MFDELNAAIAKSDVDAVQLAIHHLGGLRDANGFVPDEVSIEILRRLQQDPALAASALAAHLMNHFEFHANELSAHAKGRCVQFLRAGAANLTHFHAVQVVVELRSGPYLRGAGVG